jgi:hypothetical protein
MSPEGAAQQNDKRGHDLDDPPLYLYHSTSKLAISTCALLDNLSTHAPMVPASPVIHETTVTAQPERYLKAVTQPHSQQDLTNSMCVCLLACQQCSCKG